MTQKEKAKAYDKLFVKAQQIYNKENDVLIIHTIEDLFPELAESDDERIRKALLEMVHDTTGDELWVDYGVHKEDALAWLEKQCEHANFRNKIQIGDKVTRNRDGVLVNLSQLNRIAKDEKQGKQKPTDKVEPKFRVGDKIRRKTPRRYDKDMQVARIESDYYLCNHLGKFSSETISFSEESNYELVEHKPAEWSKPKFKIGDWVVYCGDTYQITGLNNNTFTLTGCDGSYFFNLVESTHEPAFHLWTIQDAKVGDVLYIQHDGKEHIIIYKGVIRERFRTFVSAYCAYNGVVDAFCFADVSRYHDIAYGGIVPATKEQRELLFQKMKKDGYMWDADKKELNK